LTAERRYLHLNAYLRNSGGHEAACSGRSAASLAGGLR
jgi:hypothetical protein